MKELASPIRLNERATAAEMKTLLICHDDAPLDRETLARWLGSFSNLVGIVIIRENAERARQRIKREIKRVGLVRFLDVIAFRIYYKLFLATKDQVWQEQVLARLNCLYPEIANVPMHFTHSPNSSITEEFIRQASPDLIIARCKTLLRESIFSIATKGTFVMHPGICPQYRNAHGCFWALVNDDLSNVGMTLLKIDKGVDTGPVYGFYHYDYDEVRESHIIIQNRVVVENLDRLRKKLIEIYKGEAEIIDTSDRQSAVWGQPWLTAYLKWKRNARRRKV